MDIYEQPKIFFFLSCVGAAEKMPLSRHLTPLLTPFSTLDVLATSRDISLRIVAIRRDSLRFVARTSRFVARMSRENAWDFFFLFSSSTPIFFFLKKVKKYS